MRGSILITFDENLDGRGGQSYNLSVGGQTRDLHFTDANNLYSTFVTTGQTVIFTVNRSSYIYKSEVVIKRLDFTNDDEEGDRGIKETIISPAITYPNTSTSVYTFTATTIASAYNYHYVIEGVTSFCYDNASGFTSTTGTTEVTDIDILSNGKVMISGEYTAYRGTSANRIVQLNDDGTINTGFTYGTGFSPDTTNELVELSNGKLVVVGQFTSYNGTSRNRIIGLNADGSVNTGFTIGTGFNVDPGPIERQSDDKVIIGGRFWEYNGTTSPKIIRLNTDGTYDNTFVVGSGFTSGGTFNNLNSEVSCLAIQSDGKIIVGGNFDAYSGTSVTRICRLNSDGSLDNTFSTGTGLNGVPRTIKIQLDGKILVGGLFTSYNGTTSSRIIRLNSDGTIDGTFVVGTGFNGDVLAIEFAQDGTLIVGGGFSIYNGTSRPFLANLNLNGSINLNFNASVNSIVNSIAVASDGDIYIGGLFSNIAGVSVQNFARLGRNGTVYSCLEPTPTPTPTPTFTPTPTPTIPIITPTPTPTINVNCFNVGTGFVDEFSISAAPRILAIQSDDKIVVASGGYIDYNGTYIDDKSTIRLNSNGTYDNTFITSPNFTTNQQAIWSSKKLSDDKMYLGGNFTSYSGQTKYRNIVKLNSNGSVDTSFNPTTGFEGFYSTGIRYSSNVRTIDTQSDGKIICGGNFTKYNNVTHYYLVRLTTGGTIDNTFNEGFTSNINVPAGGLQQLKVLSNDKIIIVASDVSSFVGYTGTTGGPFPQVLRLNSDGTIDNTFTYGLSTVTGIDSGSGSITELPDGKLIITGKWIDYNGTTTYGIVKLNVDGSLDTSFNIIPIGFTYDFITNINVQPDGKIICVGSFTEISNRIVRLNSNGTFDNTFNIGSGFTASGYSFQIVNSIVNQSTGKLVITGQFTNYNGITSNNIVRLQTNGTLDNC